MRNKNIHNENLRIPAERQQFLARRSIPVTARPAPAHSTGKIEKKKLKPDKNNGYFT
jgi:hypothetical protein